MRKKKPYVKIYYSNFKSMKKNLKTKGKRRTQDTFRKIEKLQQLVEKGEGGEKTNAEKAIQNILIEKGFTRQELDNPETRLLSIIERRIQKKEDILKEIKVESLSFNSFYEFSLRIIPIICKENKIDFDITNYKFLLKKFYKGGQLEKLLMRILTLPFLKNPL